MAYEKLNLKTGDRFEAEHVGHIETALAEVVSSDESKAPQATLDSRVPASLGLRVDNSVGTRIFAGETMIYGDTGWRDVQSLIGPGLLVTEGVSGGFQSRVRRVGNSVWWAFRFRPGEQFVGTKQSIEILPGSTPAGFKENPASFASFGGSMDFTGGQLSLTNEGGSSRIAIYTTANWRMTSYGVSGFYSTNEPWPASLPGLPA